MTATLIIAAALVFAALFMTAPSLSPARRRRLAPFEATLIAHRGLFDNGSDAPENTLPAIRAAAEAGFGLEIDVRLTKDGRLVVAHDPDLRRIAGSKRRISDMTADELASASVFGSGQGVPLFSDAMAAAGRAPLIVEIKAEGLARERAVCRAAARLLAAYPGSCCVQAFSPTALLWFRLHRPDMLRGQLSMNYFTPARRKKKSGRPGAVGGFMLGSLLFNFISRPDYVAYDFRDRKTPALWLQRRLYKTALAAWTLKSRPQLAEAAESGFDILIFDGFDPEL